MPAINVAKTDTFEIQRQKINQIGDQIFNIYQGGSDLSTGNLKLGDGTRTSPSLAFISDPSLGLYKAAPSTFGFVSSGKKIADYSEENIFLYKELILQKNIISSSGILISNPGTNYDSGNYNDVPLLGGTGIGATANIEVTEFTGNIVNVGKNYIEGSYTDIPISSGSGTGAVVSFIVEGISGNITNSGTGYVPNNYNNISLSGGSGSGAKANIGITGDISFSGSINSAGSGYAEGSYISVPLLNKPTIIYTVTSVSNPGTPPPANVFQINGVTQQTLTLIQGNTYRFDVSDASMTIDAINFTQTDGSALPTADYTIIRKGTSGSVGSFVDLVIKPSATLGNIKYESSSTFIGAGATITIASGASSNYGTNGSANITVDASGVITGFTLVSSGFDYKQNDVLQVYNGDVGGTGSGFEYTLGSATYNGEITSIEIVDNGINYLKDDILSVNPSDVGGFGSGFLYTITSEPGIVKDFEFSDKGSNYQINDNLFLPGEITGISSTVSTINTLITVTSVSGISSGSLVVQTSGTGSIASNTTVVSVNSINNTIVLSDLPTADGSVILSFIPSYGNSTVDFEYKITNVGEILGFSISNGGNGYSNNDILTVNNKDLIQPITINVINRNLQTITFQETIPSNTFSVGDIILLSSDPTAQEATIYAITTNGGNIESLLVDNRSYSAGNTITNPDISPSTYTINTASGIQYRYFLDDGSGYKITPSFTLYSGNIYVFDTSDLSNSNHIFALSKFRDGKWGPSLIENVSATLNIGSNQILVSDTTGILPGMAVTVESGLGQLQQNTTVLEVINSTTILLSLSPANSGASVLTFRGVEYTEGVTRSTSNLVLNVNDNTPNLYYYCASQSSLHVDEGGINDQEAVLTINLNNPKIFGEGFLATVTQIETENIISSDVNTGNIDAISFTGNELTISDAVVTNVLSVENLEATNISSSSITSNGTLNISGSSIELSGNTSIGSAIQITASNGNITTSGVLQTNGSLNVDNILTINNGSISTSTGNNLILSPASGSLAVVNSSSAFVIPSGSSLQRPANAIATNGAIRFNTDSGQYEGYSETTSTWSSLGGIRDLDGNTYIAAEAFTGANDNVLYFYNDGNNTLKLTRNHLDFNTVKRLRSLDINLPVYTEWSSNAPVTLGDFVKYRNNLYEVTQAGTTGTSGTEPTHTTGSQANGTAVLTWYSSAVAPLSFEEISELRVGPNGNLPLVINSDLRLFDNTISTDVNDLLLQPNEGKKVTVNANTSLVIPVGDSNQRGAPAAGSIRYNTSITQFEGYSGTNWSSLGGVRDVDGNTYIIPETIPGSNENTLYFYNDNLNTLRVTTTAIDLDEIDTIRSITSNTLNIQASLITFDNLSTSIENTLTSTFISSTKDNLDLGLSQGLNNDPLLRLENTGDIYYNIGFGTGVYNGVKIFDSELKELEIADFKISTSKINLSKGTINSGSAILYNPSINESSKVQVIAHNTTTGDKEFIEYSVIDNGTDIFFTEYNNLKTGEELISSEFDFTSESNVRITFTVSDLLTNGDNLVITVISNVIKR
jgi:hypothetical protein